MFQNDMKKSQRNKMFQDNVIKIKKTKQLKQN